MRLRRKICVLLIVAVLLCSLNITALAHEVPDLSAQGSIHIIMRQGETVVPGGSFALYKVGAVHNNNGNYDFVLTGDFTDCGIPLEDIQAAGLAKKLAGYVEDYGLTGIRGDIGNDGMVAFDAIEVGLYLVIQTQAAEGYNKAEPFLVSIPMLENGQYVYDVDASPKVELEGKAEPEQPTVPKEPENPAGPVGPTLPQTGQLNWPVPVLAVMGLILFSAGWLLRFGKKKDGYAE